MSGLEVDEELLAQRIRGDGDLLDLTERMIVEWTTLVGMYEEQLTESREALARVSTLLER